MESGWYFSPDHGHLCQVLEVQTLWGETTCRVWLPGLDSVVLVPATRLQSLETPPANAWQMLSQVVVPMLLIRVEVGGHE